MRVCKDCVLSPGAIQARQKLCALALACLYSHASRQLAISNDADQASPATVSFAMQAWSLSHFEMPAKVNVSICDKHGTIKFPWNLKP